MGFWSWLFGWSKKEEPEIEEVLPQGNEIEIKPYEHEEIKRRVYKQRPLTKEDILFVQEMTNKAKTPDPKITPFVDKTDPKYIEKVTNELKEKLARKK